MNWINAKDRLPEDGAVCLIYIKNKQFMEVADFNQRHPASFDLQDEASCCCNMRWYVHFDDNDIYWIPIDEIPKPL